MFSSSPGGATVTVVHHQEATRILQPSTRQNTHHFINRYIMTRSNCNNNYVADFAERISFAEHWKLVAESSEFHLTLSRAHGVYFFQIEIRKKA